MRKMMILLFNVCILFAAFEVALRKASLTCAAAAAIEPTTTVAGAETGKTTLTTNAKEIQSSTLSSLQTSTYANIEQPLPHLPQNDTVELNNLKNNLEKDLIQLAENYIDQLGAKPKEISTADSDDDDDDGDDNNDNKDDVPEAAVIVAATASHPKPKSKKHSSLSAKERYNVNYHDDDNYYPDGKVTNDQSTETKPDEIYVTKVLKQSNNENVKDNNDDNVNGANVNYNSVYILCIDLLQNHDTCRDVKGMLEDEEYFRLVLKLTTHAVTNGTLGIYIILFTVVFFTLLNFSIFVICAFVRPLRALFIDRIVNDLKRRYYFASESEMRIIK